MDSLKYCQKRKGLDLCAFCIMTSHVHLIIGRNGDQSIQDIIRDLKKFTSVTLLKAIAEHPRESGRDWLMYLFEREGKHNSNNRKYQFWQQHSHPLELNTNTKVANYLNYIHNNPVKAGFVYSPEDYVYSSASNYAGLPEKLIDVIFIG